MSGYVRISEKAAAALLGFVGSRIAEHQRLTVMERDGFHELQRALAPRPTRQAKVSHKSRKLTKAEKRDETAAIWEACAERAEGKCESCGCGFGSVFDPNGAGEMDHFFGRGKVRQSARNCWLLCRLCHHEKTNNRPDAATWLKRYRSHCLAHGYKHEAIRATSRLAFIETRSSLPAAPRTT